MEAARLLSAGQVEPGPHADRRRAPHAAARGDGTRARVRHRGGQRQQGRKRASLADQGASNPTTSPRRRRCAVSFAAQAQFDVELAREMAEEAAGARSRRVPSALARAAELAHGRRRYEGCPAATPSGRSRGLGGERPCVVGDGLRARWPNTRRKQAEDPVPPRDRFGSRRCRCRGMGLGIALFRRNDMTGGTRGAADRGDPRPLANSLLRSYLGKSYYEEKSRTKRRPPSFSWPRSWIRPIRRRTSTTRMLKQTYNRPVEALEDLQKSVELNDNRAVYRSRMLLDQDRTPCAPPIRRGSTTISGSSNWAWSSTRVAAPTRISRTTRRTCCWPATIARLPGFAPAFLSEVAAGARIYQPISTNAARPDIVNESVSRSTSTRPSSIGNRVLRGFAGRERLARRGHRRQRDLPARTQTCPDPDQRRAGDRARTIIGTRQQFALFLAMTSRARSAAIGIAMQRSASPKVHRRRVPRQHRFRAPVLPPLFAIGRPVVQGYASSSTFRVPRFRTATCRCDSMPFLITPERFDSANSTTTSVGYHRMLSPSGRPRDLGDLQQDGADGVARFDMFRCRARPRSRGRSSKLQYVQASGADDLDRRRRRTSTVSRTVESRDATRALKGDDHTSRTRTRTTKIRIKQGVDVPTVHSILDLSENSRSRRGAGLRGCRGAGRD